MASWLTYGVDDEGRLISVETVARGHSTLCCPYCGRALTAKKGRKLAHHFAHTEATCQDVRRKATELPTLPCYDRFNLLLSPKYLRELERLWHDSNHGKQKVCPQIRPGPLTKAGCLQRSGARSPSGSYKFTNRGKIPFGGLPLKLFATEQDILVGQRELALSARIAKALGQGTMQRRQYQRCDLSIQQPLTDLRLYRAQLRRVLGLSLYYLKVTADGERLYKIGLTRRLLDERFRDVRLDLAKHFRQIEIEPVGQWAHRGSCELYFKHRYHMFNRPIGSLSEYFQFPTEADAKATLQDLGKLKSKPLDEHDQSLLDEEPSYIEQVVAQNIQAYRDYEHSQAIKAGMQQAARKGKTIGRSTGRETTAKFLAKPKSKAIAAALKQKTSIRQVAQQTGTAINTVRKVKKLLTESE